MSVEGLRLSKEQAQGSELLQHWRGKKRKMQTHTPLLNGVAFMNTPEGNKTPLFLLLLDKHRAKCVRDMPATCMCIVDTGITVADSQSLNFPGELGVLKITEQH